MAPPVSDIDLFLIGGKGNGRSATGNTILGIHGAFKESNHFDTETRITDVKWSKRGRLILKVVDGPYMTDGRSELVNSVDAFIHCNRGFHALVFVLNYASPRLTAEDLDLITLLKNNLGKNVFKDRGILVFTHGECFDLHTVQREWMTFDTWCQQQEGALGDFIKECGNRVVLFHNLTSSKHEESVNKLISLSQGFGKIFTCDFFTNVTRHREKKHVDGLSENVLARIDMCLNDLRKYLVSLNLTDYRPLKDSAVKLLAEIKNEASPTLDSLQTRISQLTRGERTTSKQLDELYTELQKVQEPYRRITLTRNSHFRNACSMM